MPIATFKATSKLVPGAGLQVKNNVRDFDVVMDEPTELGGSDKGMNPVEMVLCALGSCQAIVAKAFAKANHIDLEDYWIELEGDLDTDGFLKGAEGVRMGFQEVRFNSHFKTNASEEEVKKFQEFIQSRCPVGDTLLNGIKIVPGDVVLE